MDGVLEVIGPKNMALIGGSIGFWVKSTGLYGKAEVGIYSERFGHHTINVDVRKE